MTINHVRVAQYLTRTKFIHYRILNFTCFGKLLIGDKLVCLYISHF